MTAKFPFDWQKDLTLLTLVARVREVLVVHPSVPVNTMQDLVAYAKNNPRKISFGSAGTGTFTHLAVELLKIKAKIDSSCPMRSAARKRAPSSSISSSSADNEYGNRVNPIARAETLTTASVTGVPE
jgi:hypothetical protein